MADSMMAGVSTIGDRRLPVQNLLAGSSEPFNLFKHRDEFNERALRDVTIHHGDHTGVLDPSNPVLVGEEEALQKEYLSKLKFTYLEQEAKRNFIRSIMVEDPRQVPEGENEALERSNAEKKAALKRAKVEAEEMRSEAIQLAKSNAAKHVAVTQQLAEVQSVQKQIRDMELELARIKATYPPENRITAAQAGDILDEQTAELERLMEEQTETGRETDEVRERMTRTAKEVQRLERERDREEARAKEVQEGREAGDTKVDEMCRWLNSNTAFYKDMMGIKAVTAVSDTELHLEYDALDRSVVLMLAFDPLSKRLVNAQLDGSEANIEEAFNLAQASNDVPGFIADVLILVRRA